MGWVSEAAEVADLTRVLGYCSTSEAPRVK